MNDTLTCFSLIAALGFASASTAQQVWTVHHAGGPGVDFLDLPPAVAAAAPGDEIRIYSGAALSHLYTPAFIDKGIRIAGFRLGSSPGNLAPTSVAFEGLFVIAGVPAGQQVTLSNMIVRQPFIEPGGIVALDCEGDIVIEDWNVRGWGYDSYRVHFQNCANVVMRGCQIHMRGTPLEAVDSNLLLSTTSVDFAGPWGTPGLYSYPYTTETVRLTNSTATFIGSVIRGTSGLSSNPWDYNAKSAVRLYDSTMYVGPGSTLRGGAVSSFPLVRRPGFWAAGVCDVTVDPRAIVDIQGIGTVPSNDYVHAVYSDWLVAGEPYSVVVNGPPGGFAVLATGDYSPFPQLTSLGTLVLDPATIVVGAITTLPANNGIAQLFLNCPASTPVAHAFAFQAVTLAPDGTLALTVPSPCTVGWPHGQLP